MVARGFYKPVSARLAGSLGSNPSGSTKLKRESIMFFCIKCKQQFGSHMSRYGDCPYCGTMNMVAQKRKDLEFDALFKNSDAINKLLRFVNKRKLGR